MNESVHTVPLAVLQLLPEPWKSAYGQQLLAATEAHQDLLDALRVLPGADALTDDDLHETACDLLHLCTRNPAGEVDPSLEEPIRRYGTAIKTAKLVEMDYCTNGRQGMH